MKTTERIQDVKKKTDISTLKTNILATTEILRFRFIIIVIIITTVCRFYESLSSEFQAISFFLFFFFFSLKTGLGEEGRKNVVCEAS